MLKNVRKSFAKQNFRKLRKHVGTLSALAIQEPYKDLYFGPAWDLGTYKLSCKSSYKWISYV